MGGYVDPMAAILQQAQSMAQAGSSDPTQVASTPEEILAQEPVKQVEQPGDLGGVPVTEAPPSTAAAPEVQAGAPPPEAPPAPAEVDPEEVAIDKEVADMRTAFDFKLEDVVPADILAQLKTQSQGRMSIGEIFGIAGVAATNPTLAAQILSDHEQGKRSASNTLAVLSQQVLSTRKEGERQIAMYGRYLRRAHEESKKTETAEAGKEKLARMAEVSKVFKDLRADGIDPAQAGIMPPSEEELKDPEKFFGPGGWFARTNDALGKVQGKQRIDEMLAGARQLPVSVLAQKGIDPSAAILNLMQSAGFSPEEIAQRMPAVQALAKGANLQLQKVQGEIAKDAQWLEWSKSTVAKNGAAIDDINSRIRDRETLQPEEVLGMGARLQGLENQLLNQIEKAKFQQSYLKYESDASDDPLVKASKLEQSKQIGQSILDFGSQLYGVRESQVNLEVIAKQGMAMVDPVAAFWTTLPQVLESTRTTLLTTAGRIPGANPDQMFEAMQAASSPETWNAFLRGDPNNPFRQMFWTAMLAEIQLKTHMRPEQIFQLLNSDLMTPGTSPADTFVGSDVTLPPTIQQSIGATQQPSSRVTPKPQKEQFPMAKGH